jgi:hypothetical protein
MLEMQITLEFIIHLRDSKFTLLGFPNAESNWDNETRMGEYLKRALLN